MANPRDQFKRLPYSSLSSNFPVHFPGEMWKRSPPQLLSNLAWTWYHCKALTVNFITRPELKLQAALKTRTSALRKGAKQSWATNGKDYVRWLCMSELISPALFSPARHWLGIMPSWCSCDVIGLQSEPHFGSPAQVKKLIRIVICLWLNIFTFFIILNIE